MKSSVSGFGGGWSAGSSSNHRLILPNEERTSRRITSPPRKSIPAQCNCAGNPHQSKDNHRMVGPTRNRSLFATAQPDLTPQRIFVLRIEPMKVTQNRDAIEDQTVALQPNHSSGSLVDDSINARQDSISATAV